MRRSLKGLHKRASQRGRPPPLTHKKAPLNLRSSARGECGFSVENLRSQTRVADRDHRLKMIKGKYHYARARRASSKRTQYGQLALLTLTCVIRLP